ncbi:MAG: LysR family transcriptional regulator [Lachnospiraceae bacterium]
MDLKLLEYVVAIAEHGNITKAAESLFITQSGLNQQLIKLEKELNIQLFYRNKRHLHPTLAGNIYIENARKILDIKKNTYSRISDLTDGIIGEVSLGVTWEHGIDMFLHVFPAFNKRYPDIRIQIAERTVDQQHTLLSAGKLDLGFLMLTDQKKPENHYFHLCDEPLVLGIPLTHPMAKYAAPFGEPLVTIDLSYFRDDKFSLMFSASTMRDALLPFFEASDFKPHILCETAMNYELSRLVEEGLCCTILPQSRAATPNAAWFHIAGHPKWEWTIAYPKSTHLNKSLSYILELAAGYARLQESMWKN